MDDLISREAAIEPFMDNSDDWVSYDVRKILKGLPSAQKKGKWKKVYEGNGLRDECGECGERYPNAYAYNFCPNCGARMDGE